MMSRMDPEEFLSWMVYREISPFGEVRDDFRHALIWSLLATVHSDPKKNPRGIGVDKYPLFKMNEQLEKPRTQATPKSLFRALKAIADATAKKPS